MSQRAVLRGFFLCIFAILAALPSGAQTITFSANPVTFAVGETSPTITAQITFSPTATLPGGLQVLDFGGGTVLPYGITTVPSTVSYTTAPGQTSATVTFRLAAAPWAWPGGHEVPVNNTPTPAYGLLNFIVQPLSVVPSSVRVAAGSTSASLTATVGYIDTFVSGQQHLIFTGLPQGASPVPSPVTFTPVGQQGPPYAVVSFRISTTSSTPAGNYTVSVQAGPVPSGTDTFVLTVERLGSLSVVPEKTAVDACPGGAAVQNSILISSLGGYTGSPTVTFPSLASELKVTPVSIPVDTVPPSRTVVFEVSALAGALPGQKVVNVLVSDPGGPFGVTSFVVTVGSAQFAPVVSPAAVTLTAGGAGATVTASLAPGACSPPSRIAVIPSSLPAGVTVSPVSAELLAPSYEPIVFTFSAPLTTPAGNGDAVFTFEPSTGTPKTVTIAVSVVRPGRIGIEVERSAMDICPGGKPSPNSLMITPLDGYSGSPTVTFPTLPAGLTITPATIPVPAMPPAQTVLFTVQAAAGTASGPSAITALVSDARGVRSTANFVANVLPPAFTPSVAPSAAVLNPNGAAVTFTASLVVGGCPPTADVVVTPSGLPPGVTVTPAAQPIGPPAFPPTAFSFAASSSAAPGRSTILFTFRTSEGTARTATAVINVCGPPEAPVSPVVTPKGNPSGPVTATDFLGLAWAPPASGFTPTRYEWRINGGDWASVEGTSASAPPRGSVDPVQLFVRAWACTPDRGPGAEAASPVYALSPPVASFSVPSSIVAGRPVTFTDTSSPQATSWLWFPGDGMTATTVQSPTVTFPAAGPKVVVLIASNGSGTSSKAVTVNVLPASAARPETGSAFRALERKEDGRLALDRVEVEPGTTLLLRRLEGEGSAVAFLRFVDVDGKVVVERRLVLAAGEEARHDLSAWGAKGAFRVELVGPEGLDATVEERSIRLGGPEVPVRPGRPRGVELP
ncbi:MAG: hypothetical protein IPP07_31650 [Holophagales bacterium]|nr:hypothetical protein [Holophagales bacterium]